MTGYVFKCMTCAELVKQWLGTDEYEHMKDDLMDPTVSLTDALHHINLFPNHAVLVEQLDQDPERM